MATLRSPLAPARFPSLPPVAGVRLATHGTGVRYRDRDDVCLIELAPGTRAAGVLTRSLTASAPVEWCRRAIGAVEARAVLINAGNANAFTGAAGLRSVERCVGAVARSLECAADSVFVASTGVIGVPLADDAITAALGTLRSRLSGDAWKPAARAIMTTDTFPKGATRTARIDGVPVTLNGFAKGSGMIAPDMATMLAFVLTDAAIAKETLQRALARGCDRSFNAITVDSDTSTSDTLLLFATGRAGHAPVSDAADRRFAGFRRALESLLIDLAHQVVRDGEGAQKFVTVTVTGAASARAARRIGLTIANSPLVKTAIAGEDANWGRIVMAVGKAGEKANRDHLAVAIGGVAVARDGMVVEGYDEAPVTAHMKGREIDVEVDVGVGRGRATVWTCDLTKGYIDINAHYRS
jgi:glutamate N-acetyltransferase/amino-acid N-acetyltransferase